VHESIRSSPGPPEARQRIERCLPGLYLELFAREAAPGWTTWGNELMREAAE
jgi:N6-adenosine-specific RNA methylase IME4